MFFLFQEMILLVALRNSLGTSVTASDILFICLLGRLSLLHRRVDYFQESTSKYEHVEVSTGGKLSRHNIHIQQVGPDTVTELSTFHMCVSDQTQDLHSRLVLDHPRGVSQQIHKCIVAHSSGQAVFDGNVQVNRYCILSPVWCLF